MRVILSANEAKIVAKQIALAAPKTSIARDLKTQIQVQEAECNRLKAIWDRSLTAQERTSLDEDFDPFTPCLAFRKPEYEDYASARDVLRDLRSKLRRLSDESYRDSEQQDANDDRRWTLEDWRC